ncbi:MAG: prepilin peptidase, partial [Bradyrhizobium sp.]
MDIGSAGRQIILSLTLLAAVGASLVAAPGPDGMLGAFLGALMLAIAISDFRRYIIPNELTGAALGLALLRAATVGPEAGWDTLLWATARALAIALPLLGVMAGYR